MWQTELDLTYKDSRQRILFSCTLVGTVPSGLGPRTTLGNTLYNMAFQNELSQGIRSRGFAAGDDGILVIPKEYIPEISERIGKLVKTENKPGDHGLGLLIDRRLNFDDTLISFLSKVIDIKVGYCVRELPRVASTGCMTSSTHPMEEINYCVENQILDYINTFGFTSLRAKRLELPKSHPGKKLLNDAIFQKENEYKLQFSKTSVAPYTYVQRYMEETKGVPLNYHPILHS